ncbi:hypothetical protein [Candidatus Korobacter versatilis]|nr:hypothetical protein [Candidatus Koribacter versatilis]
MMSKCANPNCSSVFRYLRDGKLFQVPAGASLRAAATVASDAPKPPTRDEFFWLCGTCSKELTIVVDPVVGVQTVRRTETRVMRAAG